MVNRESKVLNDIERLKDEVRDKASGGTLERLMERAERNVGKFAASDVGQGLIKKVFGL